MDEVMSARRLGDVRVREDAVEKPLRKRAVAVVRHGRRAAVRRMRPNVVAAARTHMKEAATRAGASVIRRFFS